MTRILLLEDDHLQAQLIKDAIEQEFTSAEVETIRTEHDFKKRMDEFVERPPDMFVLDVMVRWQRPGPDEKEPSPGEYFRAGLRCLKLLRERRVNSPVILYTVSSEGKPEIEMWKDVFKISKEETIQHLINAIRKNLNQRPAVQS